MNNKDLINIIKAKLNLQEINLKLIFQDGYQIYYDGNYICNLNG